MSGASSSHDAVDDSPEARRRELHHLLPGVEPRQPQQVGDEPFHPRGVAEDDLQELARLAVFALVEQRLDVAANGGQRRAQFVRDVGDEVAAHLVRPPEVGDVVQHQHGAVAGRVPRRGRAGDDHARGLQPQGELHARRLLAAQRAPDLRDDVRMTDRVGVATVDPRVGNAQHPLRRAVHEPEAAVLVEDQDAFDHPREDRLHARPVAREIRQPAPELENHGVERSGHPSELVAAVVDGRAGELAGGIAVRDVGNRGDTARQRDGERPRERERHGRAERYRQQREGYDPPQLLPHVSRGTARRTNATSAWCTAHRGVEHLGVDGGADAACASDPVRARLDNLGAVAVFFEGREPIRIHPRIAEHPPVGCDESDPRLDERGEPDGLRLVAAGSAGRLVPLDLICHESRLEQHALLDALVHLLPQRPEQQAGRGERRDEAGTRRGEEDLPPEACPHGASPSLYPNCGTVMIASARMGSFSLSRRTWTSTVRVPPV